MSLPRAVQGGWLVAVMLGLGLALFGWLTTPGANLISLAGASLILAAYGGAGLALAPRLHRQDPRLLRLIGLFGLLASAVFLCEIALEYVLQPFDNTAWGYVEYGAVFLLLFIAGLVSARQTRRFRVGVLAGLGSALLASLMFVIVVLVFFYVFRGTTLQAQVLMAEGSFADFARSGMKDFNIFIIEDILGAVFFHSLLLPLAGALLSLLGALIGKGLTRLPGRDFSKST
jgi:hypothetical protein